MPDAAAELARVRDVLRRSRSELGRRFPGYVGSGVGAARPGGAGSADAAAEGGLSYVVVVYLNAPENVPPTPQTLEEIPIRFEVTGEFRALGKLGKP